MALMLGFLASFTWEMYSSDGTPALNKMAILHAFWLPVMASALCSYACSASWSAVARARQTVALRGASQPNLQAVVRVVANGSGITLCR